MISSLETFELLAELSLALAGFSGVAASFGGRGRDFREIERSRLTAILQFSAISLAAALMVICLPHAGLEASDVYASAGLVSGVSMSLVAWRQYPLVFRLARSGESSTSNFFLATTALYLLLLLLLYIWTAFFDPSPWPLMIGISLQLMYGVWCFARLLLRPV